MSTAFLIAVDIGNARIKLGLFATPRTSSLPEPVRTLSLAGDLLELDQIAPWLDESLDKPYSWWVASVNRLATTRLTDWIRKHLPEHRITLFTADNLPLTVQLELPDMVGIDRLINAVAVNCLREANRPAVIVDVGTAITVDLVSADGAFQGGAILPGLQMSAQALHEFTDLLPLVDMSDLAAPPPALGKATVSAIQSGLFWGAVGSIRLLIEQLTVGIAFKPQVFLTGGVSATVARLLGPDVQHVPNLTLSGVAVTALQYDKQET